MTHSVEEPSKLHFRFTLLPFIFFIIAGFIILFRRLSRRDFTQARERILPESQSAPVQTQYGTMVENEPVDRAFVFAKHDQYGFLILKAHKARKGIHAQISGGHIDAGETPVIAVARELFEETGIDLRNDTSRLYPVVFSNGMTSYKGRAYFWLNLTDQDCNGSIKPDSGEDFRLTLSHEHVGYAFVSSQEETARLIQFHSGGKNSIALLHADQNV